MAKTLYKAEFKDKLPLGGIATGHIDFGCDASITLPLHDSSNFSFFAIKAEKDSELFDARILQSTCDEKIPLPCFEESSAYSFFPFAECNLWDSSFPAKVKITAFSPFIPLNDTDSGIPGVLFGFEVTNTSDERIDYSVCCVTENTNAKVFNRMGCTDTGEAYIHLSDDIEKNENTCIATDGKNVSFCEYAESAHDIISNFTCNTTLENGTKSEYGKTSAFGALCTHFSLNGGETAKVSFCLSWYRAENEFSRNYYAQYFESSLECASYLFRQKDRLLGDSMEFCENISGATLPRDIITPANSELFSLTGKNHTRLDNGDLISNGGPDFSGIEAFISRQDALSNLFPSLEHSGTMHFLKSEAYNNSVDKDLCITILRCFRKYILSADADELIEEWYYIVKCANALLGEDGSKKISCDNELAEETVKALILLAETVKDKKRSELYSNVLSHLPEGQASIVFFEGFSKIYDISGFEYRADTKHIGFNPQSGICPLDTGNTFRSFFCTPQGYGYVEEGIDYIEINLLKGALSIRSFGVPRTPRLVQYGGRNWKFENKNLVAVLDSDLEVTPHKKLTIFIDIKP